MNDESPELRDSASKNFFVQQVLATFKQSSPEMKVRDLEQPSHGSLRREETKAPPALPHAEIKEKSAVVLKCKELRNEALLPSSSSDIDLSSVGNSSLMARRRDRRSLT